MSKSTERPVWPCEMRYLNRLLVSSPVPKPAICRMVQNRLRYMVGYGPRVNGNLPGNPTSSTGVSSASSTVYVRFTGKPPLV